MEVKTLILGKELRNMPVFGLSCTISSKSFGLREADVICVPCPAGGVARSLCQQVCGRGDIVLAIFGQCHLPHPACMGGRWHLVDKGRALVFQKDSSEVYWPGFSGDPSRTEPQFPTVKPAQPLNNVCFIAFCSFPIFVSPPFLYFLQPSPGSALPPCSPGKTNQDTQFPHLKKPLKLGCKILHLPPKAVE